MQTSSTVTHRRYSVKRPTLVQRRSRYVRSVPPDNVQEAKRLPGWNDLARSNERLGTSGILESILDAISTRRFVLVVLSAVIGFTLYVGHVHATQDLLVALQSSQQDNLRLHLRYNRLKATFDQLTGPGRIHERARQLGLEEGRVSKQAIAVEPLE